MHATGTPEWVSEISSAPAAPAPGDAWALSWDGVHEGVVVIAQVHDDFILGIPVTTDTATSTEVTVELGTTNVALWPQAETGLGSFLLHRRLGNVLDDAQVREVRLWAAERANLSTLISGSGSANANSLTELLDEYRRRCFIEWPSETELIVDVDATGMNARQFRDATGFDTPRVLELWGGDLLDEAELHSLGDNAHAWTMPAHDLITRELATPELKPLIVELCEAAGVSERQARNTARSAYALAARTASVSERASTRAADTLRVLIQDAHAS
ncbi:hypothetical protein ACFY9N_03955 [Microbacterium sp. NPDC008134]|uniref:hypothetical protein n=1 Tax=Microbacterium sp. NPDC008134 TaxID=3364183 RepID=UPI0036E92C86